MARGLVKYDQVMISRILELASKGHNDSAIADLLGINRATLYRWKVKDKKLSEKIEKFRNEGINSIINEGLLALARGVELRETITETVELDANGIPIKIKEKITKHPPKEKALEILARRYAPELSISSERESTTNIINIDNMSYRELLEYRRTNNVLDQPQDAIEVEYSLDTHNTMSHSHEDDE